MFEVKKPAQYRQRSNAAESAGEAAIPHLPQPPAASLDKPRYARPSAVMPEMLTAGTGIPPAAVQRLPEGNAGMRSAPEGRFKAAGRWRWKICA